MAAYIQMGNDTENLVGEAGLDKFQGIVLSPVNRKSAELKGDVLRYHVEDRYDVVLDPQLYFPRTERHSLLDQPYFPHDIDTSDYSESWWSERVVALTDFAKQLGVDAVASPVIQPKIWQDDYFAQCAETSLKLSSELSDTNMRVLTTVMININQMAEQDAALKVASIISEAEPSGYYLVIFTEVEPRRELSTNTELTGIMTLIKELENTNRPVLVSHCSSDMLLFKAAGASHCATGKFFNLRRYTKSRYDEPSSTGGGQLPYWFEHNLLAFLRQEDVLLLQRRGYNNLIGGLSSTNFWSQAVLDKYGSSDTEKLLKYSWLQYLCWFGETEFTMSQGDAKALTSEWLRTAENNWLMLEDNNILMTEPRNDGKAWLRPWRQALSEFSSNS